MAYLSLGSNLGDRLGNLCGAVRRLRSFGKILSLSSVYETEPVEFTDQPWFLNAVLALETSLSPSHLLAALMNIETEFGRQRTVPKGPRTLDLDILLFDGMILKVPGLQIPHPAMHLRRFVLEPLAEIAPEVMHPVLGKTALQLLDSLDDPANVRRISGKLDSDSSASRSG